jgi:hypothetical protein
MALINPKPRFAFDPDAQTVYDYVTGRDVPLQANYQATDGQWNLFRVKELILGGHTIEEARLNTTVPVAKAPVLDKLPPKVGTPVSPGALAAEALNGPLSAPPPPNSAPPAPVPTKSLTAAQLQGLKLEPLQLAALGITPKQVKVEGLTAPELAALKMTPLRAQRLELNSEQAQALTS